MVKRGMLICMTAILLLYIVACGAEPVPELEPVSRFVTPFESEITDDEYDTVDLNGYMLLSVRSLYEARRSITDEDLMFGVFYINNSDREYVVEMQEVVLEKWQNGDWERISYQHVNVGLISRRSGCSKQVFLREPLTAGRYRINMIAYPFTRPRATYVGQPGGIELVREFDVIAHADAPAPIWNISRLELSPHDEANQSAGIRMSIANPVLDRDNNTLEILLTADNDYDYGEHYRIEVLIDGNWYSVPFVPHSAFVDIGYSIRSNSTDTISRNPIVMIGVVPAGQYRIIKEFTPVTDGVRSNIREIAMAEFTVTETLGN